MKNRHRLGDAEKRKKIQCQFWNEVGSVEHISLPRLRDAVKKEFNFGDERLVRAQIDFMRSEQRIKIESKVKVWIKRPAEAGLGS